MYIACGPSAVDPLSILNEINIDGLQLSDQQVNNNMLSGSTAEGPHAIYICYHGKALSKKICLTGTPQLMQDKDNILFRVGRPTTKHSEQLMLNEINLFEWILCYHPIVSPTCCSMAVGEQSSDNSYIVRV
jgi:hypothetical protein